MYYICIYVHIGLLVSFRWMRLPALKKRIFETFTHKQTTMYICKLYIYICMYIHTHLHVGALCQRCEVILLRRQRIPPLEHFISSHELLQYRMLPPPRRDKPARLSVLCYFCCYCLSFCIFFCCGFISFYCIVCHTSPALALWSFCVAAPLLQMLLLLIGVDAAFYYFRLVCVHVSAVCPKVACISA